MWVGGDEKAGGLTGGVKSYVGSALSFAVSSRRFFTTGRHFFKTLRSRYEHVAPISVPVMGFKGLGVALMTTAPAKILVAWSRRSSRNCTSRPKIVLSVDILLNAL
jgi:hypothetical protein